MATPLDVIETIGVGGTYTLWATRYDVDLLGSAHITPAWNPNTGRSSREIAERDAADLLDKRGITAEIVSITIMVSDWVVS